MYCNCHRLKDSSGELCVEEAEHSCQTQQFTVEEPTRPIARVGDEWTTCSLALLSMAIDAHTGTLYSNGSTFTDLSVNFSEESLKSFRYILSCLSTHFVEM